LLLELIASIPIGLIIIVRQIFGAVLTGQELFILGYAGEGGTWLLLGHPK
jgi:hypothetical protein